MSAPQVFGIGAIQQLTDAANIQLRLDQAPVASANVQSSGAPTAQVGSGNSFAVTLGGNRTLDIFGMIDGQIIFVYVTQDGTGSRTLTPRLAGVATTVLTSGTPLTTTAGAFDLVAIEYRADLGKLLYYPMAKAFA